MNELETILTLVGVFVGGVGTALGVAFGVWQHRQNVAHAKDEKEAATIQELEAFRSNQRTHEVVARAIEKATEPIQAALHENTKITGQILDRLTRLETIQFGGNSGGMRQELNENTALTRDLLQRVSHLEGAA